MTSVHMGGIVEFVISFDLHPMELVRNIDRHIVLGKLSSNHRAYNEGKTRIVTPPPESSYGLFHGSDKHTECSDMIPVIKQFQEMKVPLSGVIMNKHMRTSYVNWTFKQGSACDELLALLKETGVGITTEISSGTTVGSEAHSLVKDNDLAISSSLTGAIEGEPFIGQDESGNIVFVDYAHNNIGTFLTAMEEKIQEMYKVESLKMLTGHYLIRNEITNHFCSGNCWSQELYSKHDTLLYHPGNINLIKRTLTLAARRNSIR